MKNEEMYGKMKKEEHHPKKMKNEEMYGSGKMKKEEHHPKKMKNEGKKKKGKHDCAKHVMSEQWGQGLCVYGSHAEPDANGFVSWYDVEFNHGIERRVPINEMTVLVSEAHHDH